MNLESHLPYIEAPFNSLRQNFPSTSILFWTTSQTISVFTLKYSWVSTFS